METHAVYAMKNTKKASEIKLLDHVDTHAVANAMNNYRNHVHFVERQATTQKIGKEP